MNPEDFVSEQPAKSPRMLNVYAPALWTGPRPGVVVLDPVEQPRNRHVHVNVQLSGVCDREAMRILASTDSGTTLVVPVFDKLSEEDHADLINRIGACNVRGVVAWAEWPQTFLQAVAKGFGGAAHTSGSVGEVKSPSDFGRQQFADRVKIEPDAGKVAETRKTDAATERAERELAEGLAESRQPANDDDDDTDEPAASDVPEDDETDGTTPTQDAGGSDGDEPPPKDG